MLVWAEDVEDPAETGLLPFPCQISRNHRFTAVTSRKPELSKPSRGPAGRLAELLLQAASFPSEDILPMTSAKLLVLLLEVGDRSPSACQISPPGRQGEGFFFFFCGGRLSLEALLRPWLELGFHLP